MKKKLLAMLLAVVMIMAMFPTAFAADEDATPDGAAPEDAAPEDATPGDATPGDKVSTVKVETLIEPQYDEVKSFGRDENGDVLYAAVKVDGKWGYIDTTGEMVIEPRYDYAGTFREGVALVAKQRYYTYERTDWETDETYEVTRPDGAQICLLGADGTEVALQSYYYSSWDDSYEYEDYIVDNTQWDYETDEYVLLDPIESGWGCYDGVVRTAYPFLPDGTPIVPKDFASLALSGHTYCGMYIPDTQPVMWGPCVDGVIPMRATYYWEDYKEVYDEEYDETWEIYAGSDSGAVCFYMDLDGNITRVFPSASFNVSDDSGVYAAYAPDETGLAVVNYGRWISSGDYDYENDVYIEAEDNIRIGAMRADGTFAVSPAYTNFYYDLSGIFFSQGLWTVTKDGEKWGAVNASGREVIPLEYDAMFPFWDDLAPVQKDGQWYYIDMYNNKYQIGTPEGGVADNIMIAGTFSNDIAAVFDGERAYCIVNTPDKDGVLPAVQGTEDLALRVYFPDYDVYLATGNPGTIVTVGKYAAMEKDGKWGFYKLTFELEGLNPFDDVHLGDWHYDSVQWAVESGITTGTNTEGTEFSPTRTCNEDEILTMLYRAHSGESVGNNSDMEKAIDWAREEGLIGSDFESKTPCTRATAVKFIWQINGKESAGASSFTDVDADADYAMAVNWAVENKITKGTGNYQFSPDKTCMRDEIVTLLYRAYA